MKPEFIQVPGRGPNPLPYTPAVRVGPWLHVSGQASVDKNGAIVNDTFAGEMRRSLDNLRDTLAAAGMDIKHVVRVCSYVGAQEDLKEYNAIYREYFSEPYPARTTLIGCLGTLLKYEVDVVAYAE